MYKIHVVVAPNSFDVESDTGSILDVLPTLNAWLVVVGSGGGGAEKGKIEFKINPPENQ